MPVQRAYIDRIDNLDMVQRLGVVRALNRKVRVVWPGGSAALIPKDYKVLNRALEAVGVPTMFSTLDEPGCNALVLVERGVGMAMDTPGCVDVALKYEHILDGPNQRLFKVPQELGVVLYGKGRTSITQKPTNFFSPFGIAPDAGLTFSPTTAVLGSATITYAGQGNTLGVGVLAVAAADELTWTQPGAAGTLGPDFRAIYAAGTSTHDVFSDKVNAYLSVAGTPPFAGGPQNVTLTASLPTDNRQQIEVAHTFPFGDNDVSGLKMLPNLPNTVIQGGEIQVPFPQANYRLEGYAFLTTPPQAKAYQLIACINDRTLLGRDALTWLCSEVQWEVLDPEQSLYRFGLEFQNDRDGWNPDVVFHDQRTGRPPSGLLKATLADTFGVLRLAVNPITAASQPAGYWKVPYLRRVDFEALIGGELR